MDTEDINKIEIEFQVKITPENNGWTIKKVSPLEERVIGLFTKNKDEIHYIASRCFALMNEWENEYKK